MSATDVKKCGYSPHCCYRERALRGWMLFKWKSLTVCVWEHSCLLAQDNSQAVPPQGTSAGFWAQWEMLWFQRAVSFSDWERAAVMVITEHSYYQTALNRTEGSKAMLWPENCSLVEFHPSYLGDKSTLITQLIHLLFSLMSVTLNVWDESQEVQNQTLNVSW